MSSNNSKFTLRWGVIGLGAFAAKWINDVFGHYESDSKYGTEVRHELNAVVSTTSLTKAKNFVDLLDKKVTGTPKVYDSYEEFLLDDEIDIVYIASPNAYHYPLALQALNANKHILVEKTFTINHLQALNLKKISFEKGLFVLDGVWTRYIPTIQQLEELLLKEKIIGNIHRVSADLSHESTFSESSRLYNPNLGGGVLYDNLIYSILWTDILLLRQSRSDPVLRTWSLKSKEYPQIDETTNISLIFDDLKAVGVASGSFEVESPDDSVLIEGKLGYLRIDRASRPSRAVVYSNGDKKGKSLELQRFEGIGYYFEANVAAISIRDGRTEPEAHTLDDSIRILKVFDQVKKSNGIVFPSNLEEV
ncbi:hypothetical protein CANARDRAFT_30765 [[Candida] arabinofermentans NRRL YB-2248]|uniref:D-xylose 1-dehydrogenase (NADP(+), D-xylono-1,5-lactone-forming) n=1 Tax=[Candida] arabinofermentans NRRL YB-2248 TaxID=983967 RepID=A0A1E4SSN7_9ASCO|nr:hypothetical protein CANARDRAFT_30765 [[Candida] arabinofermentans NRRL YB-2248]